MKDTDGATFTSVYTKKIEGYKCLDCHVPGKIGVTGGQLDMSTQALAYKNLVNVPAAGFACGKDGGAIRVIPGNAAGSLIVEKTATSVNHVEPPCGSQMPLGCGSEFINPSDAGVEKDAAPLKCFADDDLDPLESWINAGAQNN